MAWVRFRSGSFQVLTRESGEGDLVHVRYASQTIGYAIERLGHGASLSWAVDFET